MAGDAGISGVVEAAVRAAVAKGADAAPGADAAEQLDMLPLPEAAAIEAGRDAHPARDPHLAVQAARRVGRPKGALNKRTAKFRDLILASGPHPGLALQRAYARPVEVLAAELGCSKLEAFREQIRAAAELLPYAEGKQPVSVEVAGKATAVLAIPGFNMPMMGVDEAVRVLDAEGLGAIDWDAVEPVGMAENSRFSGDGKDVLE